MMECGKPAGLRPAKILGTLDCSMQYKNERELEAGGAYSQKNGVCIAFTTPLGAVVSCQTKIIFVIRRT